MLKIKLFFGALVLFFMFIQTLLADNPQKITFAMENAQSFPIYRSSIDKKTKYPGTFFEFVRIMEREMAISITIERLPWKRCLSHLKRGMIDGILAASYKPKREKLGVYPQKNGKVDPDRRFSGSSYYLYVKNNSNIKRDGKKLKNVNGVIGAQLGFSIVADLKAMGVKVNDKNNEPGSIFDMLYKGRLDGAAIHGDVGNIYLHQYKNIKKLEPPLATKPYYLLVSHQIYKKHPDFVENMWNVVAKIRESGEFKNIEDKYYNFIDWPEE